MTQTAPWTMSPAGPACACAECMQLSKQCQSSALLRAPAIHLTGSAKGFGQSIWPQ